MDYLGAQGTGIQTSVGAGHALGPPWAWSRPPLHKQPLDAHCCGFLLKMSFYNDILDNSRKRTLGVKLSGLSVSMGVASAPMKPVAFRANVKTPLFLP